MRIENSCDIHVFKVVKFLSRNAAIYYRYRIQSIIDEERYDNFNVSTSEYDWLDDDDRYSILITAYLDEEKEMTKADFYMKYNATRKKLEHIIDAVGLSEEIES